MVTIADFFFYVNLDLFKLMKRDTPFTLKFSSDLAQLRHQDSNENSIYFWGKVRGSDAWRQETGSLNLKVGAIHSLDTN